jgi:predicted RNA-binding protein
MAAHRTDDRQRGIGDAGAFLAQMSDTDLLRFLRRLPMVAGMEDGTVTVSDLVYEMRLWGYVKSAWAQVNGEPGVPGRIKHVSDVYARAEREFWKDTGERRRLPRKINLTSFLELYTTEGLP